MIDDDLLRAMRRAPRSSGILLDLDGTLSPIAELPETAALEAGAADVLAALVPRFGVVAIVSGRREQELAKLVDVPGLLLVGTYGLAGEPPVPEVTASAVEAVAAGTDGVWVERKGATIAAHFRGANDPVATGELLGSRLAPVAAAAGMQLVAGKRVLELIPSGHPLKEGAVERIIRDHHVETVVYAGDDRADLLAFAALDRLGGSRLLAVAFKVAVRGPETPEEILDAADLVVSGPTGLVRLLRRLASDQAVGDRT